MIELFHTMFLGTALIVGMSLVQVLAS